MASLNLSANGPTIQKSYQFVVNAPPPTGPAAQSPTYGQWAVFAVSAPLANAFQQDSGNKESILKVHSVGGVQEHSQNTLVMLTLPRGRAHRSRGRILRGADTICLC